MNQRKDQTEFETGIPSVENIFFPMQASMQARQCIRVSSPKIFKYEAKKIYVDVIQYIWQYIFLEKNENFKLSKRQ